MTSSTPPMPATLPSGLPWASSGATGPTGTGTLTATIGGTAVEIIHGTVSGDVAVAQRSALSFTVVDPTGAYSFQQGQPVILYAADGSVLMRRWVSSAQRARTTAGNLLEHAIVCADNHYLADKRLAPYTATNKSAGSIVNDLITQFLAAEGVVATSVSAGPTIGSFISNYATVAACLDALAQKSQGYTWWIDDARELYFGPSSPTPAPVTITDALFERDTEQVTHGNDLYRNTQYILGGTAETAAQSATFVGDGNTTSFTLGYPLASVPTITLNGNAQTVGIKGVDSGKQWYWAKGDPVITQDSSGTKLVSTDTLDVPGYIGQYPVVTVSQDSAGISARQTREGGTTSGIVEAVATDTTLSTTSDAFAAAAGYLARYSQDSETLTFVTQQSGFAQGQLATVDVPAYNLNSVSMLIEEVQLSDVGPAGSEVGVLYYTVKAVVGPLNTSWVQFFGAMANQTQAFVDSINLGNNSVVNLLADFTAEMKLEASLTATVTVCPIIGTSTIIGPSLIVC